MSIPLHLGTTADPILSGYGIAFSVSYDPAVVDASTLEFDFSSSWLGTNGFNALALHFNDAGVGQLDVAITRTDQQNVSGAGPIGNLVLTTASSVNGESVPLELGLSNITLIDNQSTPGVVTPGMDTIVVVNQPDFVPGIAAENPVQVYPNPFSDFATVVFPNAQGETFTLRMMDVSGKLVRDVQQVRGTSVRIDKGQLSPGVYVCILESERRRWVNRVVIR